MVKLQDNQDDGSTDKELEISKLCKLLTLDANDEARAKQIQLWVDCAGWLIQNNVEFHRLSVIDVVLLTIFCSGVTTEEQRQAAELVLLTYGGGKKSERTSNGKSSELDQGRSKAP